ncbi:MAG: tRNA (N6-threonylcarbamoyladenosine(37)-N6)-methyltransferase TrmO [Candidatus Altiarchaeum hamiconexum]|uniref:tRNA (N6-threonylcarbamoyladenosine(37)-N6)-methyltransferase TrmO n=1 Tax=Candidatus Altarchaeum hamiconexum TaxID=1803513 RepID=A0A8J7Z0N1_9ARCH|nr:tRNA (N6-threonylcarbamoyladenosine(37)-N6)-methyltransferase TrmO [Candidatus Altarchaeum hamiconexum]NCN68458.1 tRNA (N6-threonylcarbamoyladenosine(37)-N6)-methyltransferase TrmO [Candidatus Altarchaeum hamiconexum]NCS90950.1 tRNA (N6-threonylcarbamoyladenosine(37)-N6)-methyltransferase TrmO [Candidatus Altarchaeum hamiconexum]
MNNKLTIKPIGIIHTPFKEPENVPIQPCYSKETGEVEVFGEFADGLKDIGGFSHIILIYWMHKSGKYFLLKKPFLDSELRGIFAIRHPDRPNPIGISTVKLLEGKNNTLIVKNIDVLDKTPLLDIKPYIPKFDAPDNAEIGWLKDKLK